MADLPILFSGAMVRAILREIEQPGTGKTQTRRIFSNIEDLGDGEFHIFNRGGGLFGVLEADVPEKALEFVRYHIGDRLYVREAWRTHAHLDQFAPSALPVDTPIFYEADIGGDKRASTGKFRQGMHMPRWASRITLVVEDVRVQRLREISEADAIAEGAPLDPNHRDCTQDGSNPHMVVVNEWTRISPVAWYHQLWDSLNAERNGGKYAWSANPWVAAYTFRPILANISEVA